MNGFTKAHMSVDGNHVQLSMPFAKVDKAQRLVSGFATLDNLDTQGDVVLAEASAKAFARARGNIREMHQPIAVGKIVDFREEEFFYTDPETQEGEFFRGIFVTAYVSEGAEDTWKKVLDGTLTGFSIGGEINDADSEFVKEAGRTVRFIKDYDLTELSLVDNPANQLANVFSIQKSAQGSVMKGMVAETIVENVFVCKNDEVVVVKSTDKEDCPACGSVMETAGWFESVGDRVEKINEVLAKYRDQGGEKEAPDSNSEGGVEMEEEDVKTTDEEVVEAPDEVVEEEVETAEEEKVETPEEAEAPAEVEDEEEEFAKKFDELRDTLSGVLEKSREETEQRVAQLEQKVEKATESFLNKASELESKMGEFGEKLKASKARLAELESSIEKMNASDAFRKSLESDDSRVENVQKGTSWNGAFSGRPSRFSVDDLM